MHDPLSNIQSYTLPNGLTVHLNEEPEKPFVIVHLTIHSGADQDPEHLPGVAHFVEHRIFNEHPEYSFLQIENKYSDRGGWLHMGTTHWYKTMYQFKAPANSSDFSELCTLFMNTIFNCPFNKSVSKERSIITQEYREALPTDAHETQEKIVRESVLYPIPHHRSRSPLGTSESIEQIRKKDLKQFHGTHYVPSNCTLVVSGGISKTRLNRILNQLDLPQSTYHSQPNKVVLPQTPKNRFHEFDASLLYSSLPETALYELQVLLPGSFFLPQLSIYKSVLNKLLFQEIREKRALAYSIGMYFYEGSGYYRVGIESDSIKKDSGQEIDALVKKCIRQTGRDSETFTNEKNGYINRMKMIDWTSESVCEEISYDIGIGNELCNMKRFIHLTEDITLKDMQDISAILLDHSMTILGYAR